MYSNFLQKIKQNNCFQYDNKNVNEHQISILKFLKNHVALIPGVMMQKFDWYHRNKIH